MPKVKFTADAEAVAREFAKIEAKVSKLQDRLDATGKAGKRAGKEMKEGFDPTRIAQWVGGLLAGGAALRVITQEMEAQRQLETKQAAAQVTLAAARKDLLRNMVGADEATKRSVMQSMSRVSTSTGVEERFLLAGMASAYSASGGDRAAAEAAVVQAAKFLPDRPAEIGGYAGSLLDIAKVTGSADAAVNQGFLSAVGGMSRVTSPEQQAGNIPRALINMAASDTSRETAAAIFSSLTKASADFMGAQSATAGISLTQQMEKFFEGGAGGKDPGTTLGRIRALQSDRELASAFLDKSTFEKAASGAIKDFFLKRDSAMAAEFTKDLAGIGSDEDLRKLGRQTIVDYGMDPVEATAVRQRMMTQGTDELRTGDLPGGIRGATRDGLYDVLRETGGGRITSWLGLQNYDFRTGVLGQSPERATRDVLESRQSSITAQMSVASEVDRPELQREWAVLDRLVGDLQDVVKLQLQAAEAQLHAVRGGTALAPAGADR